MSTCPISVAIPTYRRTDDLIKALDKIRNCCPSPDDIIVHIDGDDSSTEAAIRNSGIASISILNSHTQVGPGGGRNKAIAQAKHEVVASFDDDSYPIDSDYFARLLQLFERFPKAAVIGAAIYHIGEPIESDNPTAQWTHSFIGCGCAYRKSVFQQTDGYVPLPVAYGMEEVDLALQLRDLDWGIIQSPWLRVFHDTHLTHHTSAKVTAASIANLALLAYLRYPGSLWGLGIVQCFNRLLWLIKHRRFSGIVQGFLTIPQLIYRYRHHRQAISSQSLREHLRFCRIHHPAIPLKFPSSSSLASTS